MSVRASAEVLARAALPRFGIPAESVLTLLNERENVVFRVDRPDTGARCVLRLHRPGYQTAASIRSEVAWMTALRAAGVSTPRSIVGVDGDAVQTVVGDDGNRHCDVVEWIDGDPLSADTSLDTFTLLGRLNARLHQHVRTWTPPPGFVRHRWDADGMLGPRPVWGRHDDLAALDASERALLARARTQARTQLARLGHGPDRFGLIHADLMPDNVLVQRGEPHVIDFDDCGFGWFLYDLATLLTFDLGGPDFEARRAAWVDGYRSMMPLPDGRLADLDLLILCRLLVGLGWLHTRRDTPFAREVTDLVVALACTQAERLLAR